MASQLHLDVAAVNALLRNRSVPVTVYSQRSGFVRLKTPWLNFDTTGSLVQGKPQIRLQARNWLKLAVLRPFRSRRLEISCLSWVNWRTLDINLDAVPEPAGSFLRRVTITDVAIPGRDGAAISIHFHARG